MVFLDGTLGWCFGWSKDVVLRSFCVVGVAEIFDKTWFVVLICALQYGRKISFWLPQSRMFRLFFWSQRWNDLAQRLPMTFMKNNIYMYIYYVIMYNLEVDRIWNFQTCAQFRFIN